MHAPIDTLAPVERARPQIDTRPGRGLHVLVMPSWYPTALAPEKGIFFKEQAQALRAAGVRVGIVYPDLRSLATVGAGALGHNRFQREWREEAGIPTLCYRGWAAPKLHGLKERLFVRHAVDLFKRYAARYGQPDLVHAHSVFRAGVAALAIRRRFGVPYLVTEHATTYARGLIRPWQQGRVREVVEGAGRAIAVGEALRDQMRPFAGAATIEVIPNLIDTDFFTLPPPAGARARAPFRFVSVAGLAPKKGHDVLLRAFAAAFAGHADVELEIGGEGPDRGALTALAEELGIADRVRFLGRLAREEVRAALWRADHFVLASRVETFGVVLIEAMATGLPVIATRCGGPEGIVDSDVGSLVPPDDPATLAEALKAAVRERATWRARAGAIRARATERFGADAVAGRLIACYHAVSRRIGPS